MSPTSATPTWNPDPLQTFSIQCQVSQRHKRGTKGPKDGHHCSSDEVNSTAVVCLSLIQCKQLAQVANTQPATTTDGEAGEAHASLQSFGEDSSFGFRAAFDSLQLEGLGFRFWQ